MLCGRRRNEKNRGVEFLTGADTFRCLGLERSDSWRIEPKYFCNYLSAHGILITFEIHTLELLIMAPTRLKTKDKAGERRSKLPVDNTARDFTDDEIPEKDETEEKLEKLLFGDEAGFLEGLKARSADQQLVARTNSDDEDAEDIGDEGLESIADENVRISSESRKLSH
jgi:hypothetical protein